MPNTLERYEIDQARARGREKILSLAAGFDKAMDANARQKILKQLFGQRVRPIYKATANFDPKYYNERHLDISLLKSIMLSSFQAVEEIDTICDLMRGNRVNAATRADYDIVQAFADRHKWRLCQAFHTFATDGEVVAKTPSEILSLETKLARKGLFPLDILNSLMMPLRRPAPEGSR